MSRPWMPLYIADYLADTMHFNAAEHGAYLLLIMHYWQTGSLPDDEARLARIVRMSDSEWVTARVVIRPKFGEGWRHERIEGELAEAERLAQAGRKGGEASAASRRKRTPRPKGDGGADPDGHDPGTVSQADDQRFANDQGNDLPTITQAPQPPPQKEDGGGDAGAREAPLIGPEATALAEKIAVIAGYPQPIDWPPGWCGAPMRVQIWITEGWRADIALATARSVMAHKRDGPPDTIKYFEKAIAREMARQLAPLPAAPINPNSSERPHAQAPRHASSWQRSRDEFRETLGQLGEALDDAEAGERGAPSAEIIQIAATPGRR